MLTPAFELSQSKEFLTIIIKAPFAKVSETEIFIEENDFKFFSKPYFLRLNLPGNIVEDGREKANYDAEKGSFTVIVPKETPGEHFEGLDMLTKLLAPKGQTSAAPPLIQVIDQEEEFNADIDCKLAPDDGGGDAADDDNDCNGGGDDDEYEVEDYDWRIEQTPYTETPVILGAPKYGFANQKSGVFERLQEELCGVVDCPDPDTLTPAQRREHRLGAELDKFDADHYLADLYEDDVIQTLVDYRPPWVEELDMLQKGTLVEEAVELTEDEKYSMRKLPWKEYLLDETEETTAYLGLIDIVFAYCYNHRTTDGENNVESGWTISKLSATLSCLEVFSSMGDVLESCCRRSLCFPLYRHWNLTMAVLQDVTQIFKIGRRRLLKCLLEVYSLLLDQDTRYVLNDLYIVDYCVWIQSASSSKLESLAHALSKVKLSKSDVGFDLEELEHLSEAALNEADEDLTDVTDKLAEISVKNSDSGRHNGGDEDVAKDSDDSDTCDSSDYTTDSDEIESSTDCDDVSEKEEVKKCDGCDSIGQPSADCRTPKKPLIVELEADCDSIDDVTEGEDGNTCDGCEIEKQPSADCRSRKKPLIVELHADCESVEKGIKSGKEDVCQSERTKEDG